MIAMIHRADDTLGLTMVVTLTHEKKRCGESPAQVSVTSKIIIYSTTQVDKIERIGWQKL